MIGVYVGLGNTSAYSRFVAQARKAAGVPVAGARIISPFIADLTNYGAATAKTFSVVGAPTITSSGISFDGVDDAAYLPDTATADFTLTWRGQHTLNRAASNNAIVSVSTNSTGSGWAGYGVERFAGNFGLIVHGIVRAADGSGDSNEHTFTIKRSNPTVTLYIDGAPVATTSTVGVAGVSTVLGAVFNSTFQAFTPGVIRNLVLYTSALVDTDRALVEAWAAL